MTHQRGSRDRRDQHAHGSSYQHTELADLAQAVRHRPAANFLLAGISLFNSIGPVAKAAGLFLFQVVEFTDIAGAQPVRHPPCPPKPANLADHFKDGYLSGTGIAIFGAGFLIDAQEVFGRNPP